MEKLTINSYLANSPAPFIDLYFVALIELFWSVKRIGNNSFLEITVVLF